ncbi:DUF4915 domain-containing protein [Glaciecola sp. XM2]|jgi:hypothetical protein|uniref:DUF4915 domain-containing protein n=1 Tax=Glaciecola sp. XM2 TaxID=1914931 RepID=UPI001BDE9805|nr:DUF4915 domain-containing protein [Glaciecola sp. XM2]MBT1452274.1 DUF4915 domain-containing protein [Glaciecola sp. XM2]
MKKSIVLFGCGHVAEKHLNLVPAFIVDNNPDLIGTQFHDIEIKSPSILAGNADDYEVIVCTTSVSEVKSQLESYGFTWGQNAKVALLLSERMEMADLEDTAFRFLLSSGLPSSAETFSGGGIYLIEESDNFPNATKLYEGNTHGLIRHEEGYAFSSQGEGIIFLNESFELTNKISLHSALRPHGIRQYGDLWVLASSYHDSIVGVDKNGNEIFEYPFSKKRSDYLSAQHHCNDLFIVGDYAYVSMFSITGNYKRNSFDGGILEIDLRNGEMQTLIDGLTMPHSVTCDEQGYKVLDSFKGTLLADNFQVKATLPGFVRGYDADSKYYYLGESKNRNFSRLNPGRTPVSIDSRITIINKDFGFSRSIPLPKKVSEIHSLIKL